MASITPSMQLRFLPAVSKPVFKVGPALSSCFILSHGPHTPESAWEPPLYHLSCQAFPSLRTLCFAYLLLAVHLGPIPSLHTHPQREQLLLMNQVFDRRSFPYKCPPTHTAIQLINLSLSHPQLMSSQKSLPLEIVYYLLVSCCSYHH